MTPERWQRLQGLCERLESVPVEAHAAALHGLESNADIRRQTLDLLEAMRREERAQAAGSSATTLFDPPPRSIPGLRVLERIGSGGSGVVFRALRTVNGIEHEVAVKWFHAERTSQEHLDRFAREQRMLAALSHPDIVRFLDAGTTGNGRPYLVMDLVRGDPVTAACDERRMPLADRLRLMTSVCDVVQAAHRHLIVHLDLKPSNILVTGDDRVKLLDFGTAKLVDSAAALTRTEPLTLQYASPERLRSEPVSVACDVYSLGLILYELASGGWPFPGRDSIVAVAERAVRDHEIIPLSRAVSAEAAAQRGTTLQRLRSSVRGDLEAICAKALSHAPASRYATVADLGDDLRRHLAGEPIRARPLGVSDQAWRFVRRHAWSVGAAATLVLGLALAVVYSAQQAHAARRAAERVTIQNQFLASLFTIGGTDAGSRHNMTVRELLSLADTRIAPSLGDDPALAGDIEVVLARGFVSQNAYAEARALFERALQRATASADAVRESEARAGLAYVLYVQSRRDDAWREGLAALDLWKRHRGEFTPAQAVAVLRTAAATLSYVNTTDPVHREYFEACLEVSRTHASRVSAGARALCLLGLATSYTMIDSRYDGAATLLDEAVAILRRDPTSADALTTALQMSGLVARYRGRFADDERWQREAFELIARLNGPDSVAALWQRATWIASLPGIGRSEEAYREAQAVLDAARKVYPTPGSYMLWTPLFSAMSAACMTGRLDECDAFAREAVQTLGPAPAEDDPRLHAARGFLGLVLASRARFDEARPLLERALQANASRHRTPPYTALLKDALAKSAGR